MWSVTCPNKKIQVLTYHLHVLAGGDLFVSLQKMQMLYVQDVKETWSKSSSSFHAGSHVYAKFAFHPFAKQYI